MWLPKTIVDFFGLNLELTRTIHADLAAVRAERDTLKVQLAVQQNQFSWLAARVNALEYQNAALMEKAYGIKIPFPEIAPAPPRQDPAIDPQNFSFDDMGEALATELGFPSHK